MDTQAFSLVDHVVFRQLLMFQRPTAKESDIPHRTSVANAVHAKSHKVRLLMKDLFAASILYYFLAFTLRRLHVLHQSIPGQVSATLDGWSSLARDPYLGVTVHWVHNPVESPTEWSLRTMLLAFREVKGNHSGANLCKVVMEIINEAGLTSKVRVQSQTFWFR